MESSFSGTFTADEVIRICDEAGKFEESDDEFMPCGNFTDLNGAKELFPSELLAPLSMPFLTFTVQNRYPASRDSLLNKDPDCIVEGIESYTKYLCASLLSIAEILESEYDEPISRDDYSNNNFTTDKLEL